MGGDEGGGYIEIVKVIGYRLLRSVEKFRVESLGAVGKRNVDDGGVGGLWLFGLVATVISSDY